MKGLAFWVVSYEFCRTWCHTRFSWIRLSLRFLNSHDCALVLRSVRYWSKLSSLRWLHVLKRCLATWYSFEEYNKLQTFSESCSLFSYHLCLPMWMHYKPLTYTSDPTTCKGLLLELFVFITEAADQWEYFKTLFPPSPSIEKVTFF